MGDFSWHLYNKCTNTTYPLDKPVTKVGRLRTADIVCRGSIISRHHATFHVDENGNFYVQDAGSSNGLYINDVKLEKGGSRRLEEGDEVGLGISWNAYTSNEEITHYIFEVRRGNTNQGVDVIEVEIDDESDDDVVQMSDGGSYSKHDEIIEVSDEEDLLSCSQLMGGPIKQEIKDAKDIKEEPSGTVEDDPIYIQLEEMDRLTRTPDPIILNTDTSENDDDWMNESLKPNSFSKDAPDDNPQIVHCNQLLSSPIKQELDSFDDEHRLVVKTEPTVFIKSEFPNEPECQRPPEVTTHDSNLSDTENHMFVKTEPTVLVKSEFANKPCDKIVKSEPKDTVVVKTEPIVTAETEISHKSKTNEGKLKSLSHKISESREEKPVTVKTESVIPTQAHSSKQPKKTNERKLESKGKSPPRKTWTPYPDNSEDDIQTEPESTVKAGTENKSKRISDKYVRRKRKTTPPRKTRARPLESSDDESNYMETESALSTKAGSSKQTVRKLRSKGKSPLRRIKKTRASVRYSSEDDVQTEPESTAKAGPSNRSKRTNAKELRSKTKTRIVNICAHDRNSSENENVAMETESEVAGKATSGNQSKRTNDTLDKGIKKGYRIPKKVVDPCTASTSSKPDSDSAEDTDTEPAEAESSNHSKRSNDSADENPNKKLKNKHPTLRRIIEIPFSKNLTDGMERRKSMTKEIPAQPLKKKSPRKESRYHKIQKMIKTGTYNDRPVGSKKSGEKSEELKQKLQEISAKKANMGEASSAAKQGTARVKLTVNRGGFLLEPQKLVPKRRNSIAKEKVTEKTNECRSRPLSPPPDTTDVSEPISPSNDKTPPRIQRQMPVVNNHYPNNYYPNNNIPNNNIPYNNIPHNNFPSNNYPSNNFPGNNFPSDNFPGNNYTPTVNNQNPLIVQQTALVVYENYIPMEPPPPQQPINVTVDDVIHKMLHWSTGWLKEQARKLSPPEVNVKPLRYIAETFESYEQYYITFEQLLLIEMWGYLYNAWKIEKEKRNGHVCKVLELQEEPECDEVSLKMYITRQEHEMDLIKRDDVVLMEIILTRDNHTACHTLFGYLIRVERLPADSTWDTTLMKEMKDKPYAVLKLIIRTKPLRGDIPVGKKCIIQFLLSLTFPLRMFKALKTIQHSVLCDTILKPTVENLKFDLTREPYFVDCVDLNQMQRKVVAKATELCMGGNPGMYFIQGPPGTGKSTVVINIIKQILFANDKLCVLVVAPSNSAIDELVSRLIAIQTQYKDTKDLHKLIRIVRIGVENSMSDQARKISLQSLTSSQMLQEIRRSPRWAEDYKRLQRKIASTTDETETKQLRKELNSFITTKLGRKYSETRHRTEKSLLLGANIICGTLNGCINAKVENTFKKANKKIDLCVIDEATQSCEQETLIPLILGVNKMVLVGDPQQLSAVTSTQAVKDYGFEKSIFSRIASLFRGNQQSPIDMLNVQFRMHPTICQYPNRTFYRGILTSDPSVFSSVRLSQLVPYYVFTFDQEPTVSKEDRNKTEVGSVIKILQSIVSVIGTENCTVGIITQYDKQKSAITMSIKENKIPSNFSITVNTVDNFQGQERDIIITSFVRDSNNKFESDRQRLNVALTRSKYALYVTGTNNLFTTTPILLLLRQDAERRRLLSCIAADTPISAITNIIHLH